MRKLAAEATGATRRRREAARRGVSARVGQQIEEATSATRWGKEGLLVVGREEEEGDGHREGVTVSSRGG